MKQTTCLYCGEPGGIVPLRYEPEPTDLHAHSCGTVMKILHETGEIIDKRRDRNCARFEELKAELELLAIQVRDLILQRDGA